MSESKIPWPMISVGTFLIGLAGGYFLNSTGQKPEPNNDANALVENEVLVDNSSHSVQANSSSLKNTSVEPTSEQSKVLISQLKGQVDKLTEKLERSDKQLEKLRKQNRELADDNSAYQDTVARINNENAAEQGNQAIGQLEAQQREVENIAAKTDPYLTKSEVSQILSDEHSQFYDKKFTTMVNKVNEFSEQQRDEAWAFELEMKINDFIVNHQYGDSVLAQVSCRSASCMVQIKELEQGAWRQIGTDMDSQNWWPFNSSTSSSTSNNGEPINLTIYSKVDVNRRG